VELKMGENCLHISNLGGTVRGGNGFGENSQGEELVRKRHKQYVRPIALYY
jgi:hypothetical protein